VYTLLWELTLVLRSSANCSSVVAELPLAAPAVVLALFTAIVGTAAAVWLLSLVALPVVPLLFLLLPVLVPPGAEALRLEPETIENVTVVNV
jgi:hypothetical protein